MLLEITSKFKVDTEEQANTMIESYRAKQDEEGYIVRKAGYARKDKKAKGEIIATAFEVTITQTFSGFWDDFE